MQAKHFIALLASTALVNAVPNLAKRRGGEPTCSNSSETPKCCESLVPQVVNGIAVQVGVGCVDGVEEKMMADDG
ncbi:MAG: hypothetical protein M1820_000679 [Bogoriella megaspora]|nr:MAG: hypothetical protein M1820_000679 [Bogoriella megaspora]